MGRRGHAADFRRRAVALMDAGKWVKVRAHELGVSEQTLYTWRRQARLDQGEMPGLTTGERAELAMAKRRVRELETELEIHRRATELLRGNSPPKSDSQPLR